MQFKITCIRKRGPRWRRSFLGLVDSSGTGRQRKKNQQVLECSAGDWPDDQTNLSPGPYWNLVNIRRKKIVQKHVIHAWFHTND